MIRYMNMEEQVDYDFIRAHRRTFLRIFGETDPALALSFQEASSKVGAYNRVRLGRKAVAVERIVGSVGRFKEFDRAFLPTRRSLETRWKRVDRAYHLGQNLPSVVLSELGGAYFVEDGNHRVSVARYQGVTWIVTEVTRTMLP